MSSPESQITDYLGPIFEKSKPEIANKIIIQKVDFPIEKELPPSFEGFSSLHFSDTHNTNPLEKNFDLCQKISQINPDMVIISGDLTDKSNYDKSLEFIHQIAKLVGGYEKIFITTGNHEFLQIPEGNELEIPKFLKSLRQLGCNVLRNEFMEIKHSDGSIYVAGIDDPSSYTYDNSPNSLDELEYSENIISAVCSKIPSDKVILGIYHRPEMVFQKVKRSKKIDIAYCGHAHGGQIRIFNQGLKSPHQKLFPCYTKGIYKRKNENTTMIVSPGLSNTIKIPRINNPGVIYFGKLKSAA